MSKEDYVRLVDAMGLEEPRCINQVPGIGVRVDRFEFGRDNHKAAAGIARQLYESVKSQYPPCAGCRSLEVHRTERFDIGAIEFEAACGVGFCPINAKNRGARNQVIDMVAYESAPATATSSDSVEPEVEPIETFGDFA